MKLQTNLSEEDKNHLINVMATFSGRALIWRILDDITGFNRSPYANNAGIYSNVAKQDVGRTIYDDIMILCPEDYTKMRLEAEQRQLSEEKNENGAG